MTFALTYLGANSMHDQARADLISAYEQDIITLENQIVTLTNQTTSYILDSDLLVGLWGPENWCMSGIDPTMELFADGTFYSVTINGTWEVENGTLNFYSDSMYFNSSMLSVPHYYCISEPINTLFLIRPDIRSIGCEWYTIEYVKTIN